MNRYSRAIVLTLAYTGVLGYGSYLMVEHYMVMVYGQVLLIQPWYIAFEFYIAIPGWLISILILVGDSIYRLLWAPVPGEELQTPEGNHRLTVDGVGDAPSE